MFILHRIQARFRGLLVRKNVKATNSRRFMPAADSYTKFTPVSNSRIVNYS